MCVHELYAEHRVGRVLNFFSFSSRRNWDSPNPSPAGECTPPPWSIGGRAHSLARKGVGRVPIPTRERTLWYSLCAVHTRWKVNVYILISLFKGKVHCANCKKNNKMLQCLCNKFEEKMCRWKLGKLERSYMYRSVGIGLTLRVMN